MKNQGLASPFTDGKQPYWFDPMLTDYVRPAAAKAGVTKHIGWHTFRHSLATLVGRSGEDIKVVQELLPHANARMTQVYQHADRDDKRSALSHGFSLFAVPARKAS